MKWSGLFTALVTPFKEDQLDEEGLRSLIRFQMENEVQGLVLHGTTGECITLADKEKDRIIRIAKEEAPHLPLMASVGTSSTKETMKNVWKAADLRVDAALVITPYYNRPSQEGLFIHFESIAKASPIPIFLYTQPKRTGVDVEIETLKRLVELPNIIGLKESSGNLTHISSIHWKVKSYRPEFSLLGGDDALALPFLSLGGNGLISGTANLIPKKMRALVYACLDGDFLKARELHHRLTPLFHALSLESNPILLKEALKIAGMAGGDPRLPLTPPSVENAAILKSILENTNLIPVAL
jgi:4-hydroxy-tetrahydrodipicolinate synthase